MSLVAIIDDKNRIIQSEIDIGTVEDAVIITEETASTTETLTEAVTSSEEEILTIDQRLSNLENKFTLLCFELTSLGIQFRFRSLITEINNFKGE